MADNDIKYSATAELPPLDCVRCKFMFQVRTTGTPYGSTLQLSLFDKRSLRIVELRASEVDELIEALQRAKRTIEGFAVRVIGREAANAAPPIPPMPPPLPI